MTIVGNLIDNALDAVAQVEDPGTRRVAFDARVEEGTSDGVALPGAAPRRYAVLDVSDSGPGLPPGAVDDAFRRGWSTKEQGVAGRRGIGLALVAQTVDRLGGTLSVSGPPGARFTVRLPARLTERIPEQHPERGDVVPVSQPAPAPSDAAP